MMMPMGPAQAKAEVAALSGTAIEQWTVAPQATANGTDGLWLAGPHPLSAWLLPFPDGSTGIAVFDGGRGTATHATVVANDND
jgi:hypothetical protein